MTRKRFRIVPLEAALDRSTFSCGTEPLDRYFHEQVRQDIRRKVTACFTAISAGGGVAGYYTLASAGILFGELPPDITKKLPRYPSVPAVRMGRLAVDHEFQGIGLGGALLADALKRVTQSEIAAFAMIVDAKDDTAAAFYRHHGFIETASPLTLFLPMAAVRLQ